jgi:NAD(P)-dependent dehydrogenase (short-subunit alcohol dehydrogenase family)
VTRAFEGRHVLLTGAAGGLGSAVAAAFLAQGAHLTLPVLDGPQADRLVALARLEGATDRTHLRHVDLLDEPAVARMVAEMQRIDAAVHVAGGFTMGPIESLELDLFREHLDLNLTTTFLVIKHCVARMKATGYGRIVTVGSRSAQTPVGQQAAYAASKAGVVALTRAVAAELAGTDVTANCVLPSTIDTPANRAAMGDRHAEAWVKPASLAEVITFLASEAARDLRGAAIPVYGSA